MAEKDGIETFFLKVKPVKLLVRLRQRTAEKYATPLSTDIDATYSHTVKVLKEMEQFDLVEFSRKGRKKEIELTSRGEKLAGKFQQVLNEFGS